MNPERDAESGKDPDTEVVNWQREFPGPVSLVVDQETAGPVLVTGWDRNEVQVTATKTVRGGAAAPEAQSLLRQTEVEITGDGNEVRVETRSPRSWLGWSSDRVTVAIAASVPRGSDVSVETGSGRVEVRDTLGPVDVDGGSGEVCVRGASGKVDLEVGSGLVTVEAVDGRVRVSVGSGPVTIERVHGRVDVDGGSGSVTVRQVEGDVHLDTGSGQVRLFQVIGQLSVDTGSGGVVARDVKGRNISIDTGSGSVEADFDVERGGRYSFDTGSGRVSLTVPADASFRLTADAGSGPIKCLLPLTRRHSEPGLLEGVLGDGSASIEIDTSSGGISIQSRDGRGGGPLPGPADGVDRPADGPGARRDRRARDEERRLILEMVEEGRLNAEEATTLLAALDGRPASASARAAAAEPPGPPEPPEPPKPPEPPAVELPDEEPGGPAEPKS